MLQSLFEKIGADYRQWRALTKSCIQRDMRESSMSAMLHHGRTGGRSFLTMVFFYLLTGLIFIPIVLASNSLFISATLLTTYTMLMIGSLILVEYHSVVISPGDYEVLGYHPINSRTFFLVKLTNLLFYVIIFTSVLALPAVITFLFVHGFDPFIGMAAFLSVFLANVTVALWIVLFYTFILRKISADRLQHLLTFCQIGLALFVYSGFFILPRFLEEQAFLQMDLRNTRWLIFLPATWFSSFLSIAEGTAATIHWWLATLAVSVFAVALIASVGKLSLDYSANLSQLVTTSVKTRVKKRGGRKSFMWFSLCSEEQVVSKLIRSQFLNDNKFKMAVLGILPLTIFYLFLGTQSGGLSDPFVDSNIELSRSGLLYLIIFLFPMMLRSYVTQSDSYHASWIFYTAPVDLPRLILAEKNFLMLYFVLPFLIILGGVFGYYFDNILHVLLHLLVLGILSHFFLQFAFLYSPDLPFSQPNVKGQRSSNFALLMILVPFLLYLVLPLIFKFVYSNIVSYIVLVGTFMFVSYLLELLIKVRVNHYRKSLEFLA